MMAADSHTTRRKHRRQPNTQRPVWGPDPPHGHCTHAQPPPPTNGVRAQESKAGSGGSDSAPPMGALSKRFGGYPNSAPTGGAALPG